jgi:hypothetical protein
MTKINLNVSSDLGLDKINMDNILSKREIKN